MEQRTPEWFAARLGKATASKFSCIMAKTPGPRTTYRTELVLERITGIPTEYFTNGAMQWGTDNENTAALAFESESGLDTTEAGFIEHNLIEAGCSPDRLIGDDEGLEIKCPNTSTHIKTLRQAKIPNLYIPQVQGNMWITGRKLWYFVSFDPRLPHNAQLIIIPVKRDDAYIAKLEKEVTKFLEEVEEETKFIRDFSQN